MPDTQPRIVLDTIVSFNAKDFGPASRFGIEVVTPKIMLEELQ
ncbi:MAG: hypothetical protein Q8M11_05040 [Sulfuritalea sp.]|nr:hypothetical protein [Sulfuritalea sp.]MDP1983845.1 hypothetical protein [Sulfuritalea sp.]